ncbi:alpha/beta fold hydrolase [Bacillus sp. FJAT-47783]|uniref:alpha/beta hydrolase n=1 Tax=Bacillus sp. FJAT-47783 TaxID=2922712 RepID=UPI001FACD4E5|nr:alpha/beta fold hydrolase [Bacillus sp. FJAT-47783]
MIGCLCVHGFTGGPYEVEPLAEHLKRTTNWDIRVPTLPGHGETLSLTGVRFEAWIEHVEKELVDLLNHTDRVYMIGFSMGGLIAAYLSTKYSVSKLVLLSAAAYYMNPGQMFADIKKMIRDGVQGSLTENELFNRYKKKIKETPFSATVQFRKLVRFVKPALKQVQAPTLIVQGERDGIVPVKSAHYLYEVIPTTEKELCFLPMSKHHVCYGEDFPVLVNRVESFLQSKKESVSGVR